MTSSLSVTKILPQVRKTVLSIRATEAGNVCGFGLSHVTMKVAFAVNAPVNYMSWQRGVCAPNRIQFTSGSPKKLRGHVQACLAILAREGIMFGRNHPEGGVPSYGHCETDKRFRVRISQEDAKKRLSSMS